MEPCGSLKKTRKTVHLKKTYANRSRNLQHSNSQVNVEAAAIPEQQENRDGSSNQKQPRNLKIDNTRIRYTQMQLDLGKDIDRCVKCGMAYVPSSNEDRKLHEKFHNKLVANIDTEK